MSIATSLAMASSQQIAIMLEENNTKKPGQRRTSPPSCSLLECLVVSSHLLPPEAQKTRRTDKTNNILPQAHFSLPLSNAA